VGCPPEISFTSEDFIYDANGRLTTRRLTKNILAPTPRIDTTATYTYYYAPASSSPLITGYLDTHAGGAPSNHVLAYDAQGRLVSDSITNPYVIYNKVSLFQYSPGYVFEYDRQTDAVLTAIVHDTLYISGNGVVQERSLSINTHREITHTLSVYRNPLSYVNNFLLLGSDYKNGTGLLSFPIYFSQNITYDFPTQTDVRSWTNPLSVTQYTAILGITVDSQNRIKSYRNTANGNKVTYFEYY
jgi:hypothetical protein